MTKYLIAGDIHGVFYKLLHLEQYFTQVDKVLFVGDYVDRGNQPLEVLEYVTQIPNAIRLIGNHEWKYLKQMLKSKKVVPDHVHISEFDRFELAMEKCLGVKPTFFYKDENIAVSHAAAALYQHNWNDIPRDAFVYGWTTGGRDAGGYPKRLSLEEKYPGKKSSQPVIYGHIHQNNISIRENEYCVDFDCGRPDGRLCGAIFENSTLVETIII